MLALVAQSTAHGIHDSAQRMNVLLTGATGLIGSAVAARLAAAGHAVVGVTRRPRTTAEIHPISRWTILDLRDVRSPEDWTPHLERIDAVVNCAGVLQDGPRDSVRATHADAPSHLWKACEAAGVRRVVQISAAGVDLRPDTDFMSTKLVADETLQTSRLRWTILRPTLVLGRAAYGGSALFRALATLPVALRVPEAKGFGHVSVDDVAETVAWALAAEEAERRIIEMSGRENVSFERLVAAYRTWLGLRPAHTVRLPSWLLAAAFRIGDAVSMLGWRPPIRTTAWRETLRGSKGDGRPWSDLTGIRPKDLEPSLATEPASIQEKWFARLYLLKAAALAGFSLFWIATGLIAVGPGRPDAIAQMTAAGLPAPSIATWIGAATDLAVGLLIAFRATSRSGLRASLAITALYALCATILTPHLWADPLGPLVKLLPAVLLNLVLLAVLDDR